MGIILIIVLIIYPVITFIEIYAYNFKIKGIKSKDLNRFNEKFHILNERVKDYYKNMKVDTISIEGILAIEHLLKISEFDEIKTNKNDLFEEFSNTLSRKEFKLNNLLDTYAHEKFIKIWNNMPIELYAYIYFKAYGDLSLKKYEDFKTIKKILMNRLGFKKLKDLK